MTTEQNILDDFIKNDYYLKHSKPLPLKNDNGTTNRVAIENYHYLVRRTNTQFAKHCLQLLVDLQVELELYRDKKGYAEEEYETPAEATYNNNIEVVMFYVGGGVIPERKIGNKSICSTYAIYKAYTKTIKKI